jgi:hypothetical protein
MAFEEYKYWYCHLDLINFAMHRQYANNDTAGTLRLDFLGLVHSSTQSRCLEMQACARVEKQMRYSTSSGKSERK